MTKLTLTNLSSLQNEQSAINIINNNNDAIEAAVEKTLSRDGTMPNQMTSELDMNSNRVLNLPQPVSDTEPLRLAELNEFLNGTGDGNVIGPVSSVGGNYPVFSGSTGKILADSGTSPSTKANVSNPTFTGTVTAPNLVVTGNETVGGTLGVTGVATFNSIPVVPNGSFANASLANMAGDTVKGRLSTTGAPQDLTKTQLTTLINPVTSSLSGAAPASGGGTVNYLRADSSWSQPPQSRYLLNSITASGSPSALTDTTSFSNTYSAYDIEFVDLIPSTSGQNLFLEVYSGGSFQTTAYVSSLTWTTGGGTGNTTLTTGIILNVPTQQTNLTTSGLHGSIRVTGPTFATTFPKVWYGQTCHMVAASGMDVCMMAGVWYNGAAITGFRVRFASGTFNAGNIKVYGII